MNVREWLGENNQIGIDIWEEKYRHNNESFDEWLDRVSNGNDDVKQLIQDKKFLFGGRVLANRGIEGSGNYYNCFSRGFIPDDYGAIMDTLKEIGITFKYQGGQGVSLSNLRPKGAPIGKEYESDGIIPFMKMLNSITEGTSQGGARKGALMMSCDIRHKEAMDFITIKSNLEEIEKANLSLEVDGTFMHAVDTYYKTGEVVTLHEERTYSGHKVEYDITPINLYKKIVETSWDYGEPAMLFTDIFRTYNFLQYDDRYNIETSNPCGEQPLMAKSCCNLGSLNLYEFVDDKFTNKAEFDWNGFEEAIKITTDALDDIIDENASRLPEELWEYEKNANDWRNIGLGVFGYAYMLMALRLKYGSKEAIEFTDELFDFMMSCAIDSNIDRGFERGAYPKYNVNKVAQSTIFKTHAKHVGDMKFRNCSLLSIAPTGSLSNLLGMSGGIEPEFALSYTRRTDNLNDFYIIESKVVQDYREITGNNGTLPDYFVCSADIDWHDRIKTQGVIQRHIDTAISSTVNLPKETTVDEIEQLYLEAWKQGLKGVTLFRDGCKRQGILTVEDGVIDDEEDNYGKVRPSDLPRGYVLDASDEGIGLSTVIHTGCGKIYLYVKFDPNDGEPYEIFVNKGSKGTCRCNTEGLVRMTSYALRCGACIEGAVDQLKSIDACAAYSAKAARGEKVSKGNCCPSAIGFALERLNKQYKEMFGSDDIIEDDEEEITSSPEARQSNISAPINIVSNEDNPMVCPYCGAPLAMTEGCLKCVSCGLYSKC